MKQSFIDIIKSENGIVPIFEATIVFPIMFFVIIFMFLMGNVYMSKSYVDAVVHKEAVKIAAKCADPNLEETLNNKKLNNTKLKNMPYRYIFQGQIKNVINSSKKEIRSIAKNDFNSFFPGMAPSMDNDNCIKIKFENNLINYDLSVTADYKITLPFKFIFADDVMSFDYTAYANVPVTDSPELIRNVEMIIDYIQQTGLDKKVENVTNKIKGLFKRDSKSDNDEADITDFINNKKGSK